MVLSFQDSKDNLELNIKYVGVCNNASIDEEKDKLNFHDDFENNQINFDLKSIICYIRSYFKDYEERFLLVQILTKENDIKIQYWNGVFEEYNKSNKRKSKNKESDKITINYRPKTGIKINYHNTLFCNNDNNSTIDIINFIAEELMIINDLKNIEPIDNLKLNLLQSNEKQYKKVKNY